MKIACYFFSISNIAFLLLAASIRAIGQSADSTAGIPFKPPVSLTFGTKDSAYSITFGFRMQNRLLMNTISEEDLSPQTWEARVRRLRLSMRGHVYHPRLTYRLQLSFSRGDMDWNASDASKQNVSPNAVQDAMIYFQATDSWNIGFGQTKLAGNRQRVVSSGALQFFDRSPVNVYFNLDRDFGFFSDYKFHVGSSEWHWKSAVS